MPVKNCCVITKSINQSPWTRVTKQKAITIGTDEPHGCHGRKVLNRHIFIVSYGQFVERKTAHVGSTVFKLVWSFGSDEETAQVADRDWY